MSTSIDQGLLATWLPQAYNAQCGSKHYVDVVALRKLQRIVKLRHNSRYAGMFARINNFFHLDGAIFRVTAQGRVVCVDLSE